MSWVAKTFFSLNLEKFLNILYFKSWGKKYELIRANSSKFLVRVNTVDKFIVWEVLLTDQYFNKKFKIKKGDTVIDIGAHIGTFSIGAAKNASKVISFEPNPDNFKMLSKNIKLNRLKNITPLMAAISNKDGNIDFYASSTANSFNSIYGSKSKLNVKSLTLKKIMEDFKIKKINYLKIDAEGAEYDIILNMDEDTLSRIDKIVLEYHDFIEHKHNYNELVAKLNKNNFRTSLWGNFFVRKILKIGTVIAIRNA